MVTYRIMMLNSQVKITFYWFWQFCCQKKIMLENPLEMTQNCYLRFTSQKWAKYFGKRRWKHDFLNNLFQYILQKLWYWVAGFEQILSFSLAYEMIKTGSASFPSTFFGIWPSSTSWIRMSTCFSWLCKLNSFGWHFCPFSTGWLFRKVLK